MGVAQPALFGVTGVLGPATMRVSKEHCLSAVVVNRIQTLTAGTGMRRRKATAWARASAQGQQLRTDLPRPTRAELPQAESSLLHAAVTLRGRHP
jgi:hypothetical protein